MPYPDVPTCVPSNAPSTTFQEHQKIVAAEHDMGSAQSYRAGLSISEKFQSPDALNHCIVRLNKNDVIVRLKFAKFQSAGRQC